MNFRIKPIQATFTLSAVMLAGVLNAQNIQEGIKYLGNDQFNKAKEVFEGLVSKSPSEENYFYLGYFYLKNETPNIELASQNFNKGLALNPKSELNRIGLACVKLFRGEKAAANADFDAIAKDSKYRNAEVLYRIAEAYILFKNKPESIDADKSIDYSEKLLNLVKNKDKAEYYIVLGNAYYEKLDPGKAMTNYTRALEIADNKAMVYALIGNLWSRTKQNNQLALENFTNAVTADPNYSITYKYWVDYDLRTQKYNDATTHLQKYMELTGNNDANTQFNLARIAFNAKDFDKSLNIINQYWDKISDPLKYKVRALVLVEKSDFSNAYDDMNSYLKAINNSKMEGSDYGILGKIQTSLAAKAVGEEKTKLEKEAVFNLNKAIAEGDRYFDYQDLLLKINPNANSSSSENNPKIVALKKAVTTNPNDTKSWYDLALEQYNAKDYVGSIASWDKLIELIPTWETSYGGKAMALYAYDREDKSGLAAQTYQKYIDMVSPKNTYSETEKAYLAIAYSFFAYKNFHEGDNVKAQDYVNKILAIDPKNEEALNLEKQLK
ncbi:tetratricopeptide repeat protein [Apibacter adventoris]|uniref:tetratricopeptide repeat protein n=1 Tax=Apibacter adventoris TaxID=1679466 RepID=UPI0011B0DDDA|nr:hypothetical protein [Apibacter adventoris]